MQFAPPGAGEPRARGSLSCTSREEDAPLHPRTFQDAPCGTAAATPAAPLKRAANRSLQRPSLQHISSDKPGPQSTSFSKQPEAKRENANIVKTIWCQQPNVVIELSAREEIQTAICRKVLHTPNRRGQEIYSSVWKR